jgi:hypothetical protein
MDDRRIRLALRFGSFLTEARDRNQDQPRVRGGKLVPTDTEPRNHARSEVLDDDVRVFGEREEQRATASGFEVHTQVPLAGVLLDIETGQAVAHDAEETSDVALGRLDLDHVGA